MTKRNKSESGNVFVFILLGVFLFGALIFTFTKSGQQSTKALTDKQAELAAGEILNYASIMEKTVNKLRRDGCSESELNFLNDVVSGYSNPNAPGDGSCDVFEPEGGNLTWREPSDTWFETTNVSYASNAGWVVKGTNAVQNIGTSDQELMLILSIVKPEICIEINNQVGITNPGGEPPVDSNMAASISSGKYTGSFSVDATIGDEGGSANLAGEPVGCVFETPGCGTDCYNFYQVLIER